MTRCTVGRQRRTRPGPRPSPRVRRRRRPRRRAGSSRPSRADTLRGRAAHACAIDWPVAIDPVKLTPATRRSLTSTGPISDPRPMTRLNAPAGRPAADDLRQRPGAARCRICWLEHDGVPVGEGRGDFPGRNRDRKIPGRDERDHANRLARDVHRHAGPHRGDQLAGGPQRLAGENLKIWPARPTSPRASGVSSPSSRASRSPSSA